MDLVCLYITAPDRNEADKIAGQLISKRLAACVNILGEISSVYYWKGNVESDNEIALIAKTRKELIEKAVKAVKEVHSYECPCIIAYPVTGGSPDFLGWIEEETPL